MFDVSNVRSGAYWNLNRIYKGLEQATVDHSVDPLYWTKNSFMQRKSLVVNT